MQIIQENLTLPAKPRGYHLITADIENNLPGLSRVSKGIAHIFIRHTSAGLSLNENADPTVRQDFNTFFDALVPEDMSRYKHTMEGPDDMTSHIKASLLGNSVTVPVTNGRFNLGTWQGIYLCEFRNYGGPRKLTITVMADKL